MGWKVTIGIFLITFAMMFFAIRCPVRAQEAIEHIIIRLPCFSSDLITKRLRETYKEEVIGGGLSGGKEQVRLFSSHNAGDNQTWTILITSRQGNTTCLIKSGENWIVAPLIIKGDPT